MTEITQCKGVARVTVGRSPILGTDVQTWECIARDTCKYYQQYKGEKPREANIVEIDAFNCMWDDVAFKDYLPNE